MDMHYEFLRLRRSGCSVMEYCIDLALLSYIFNVDVMNVPRRSGGNAISSEEGHTTPTKILGSFTRKARVPPPHHLTASPTMATHSHSHDSPSHAHPGGDHGHTHEIYTGPGSFLGREMPIVEGRDWNERAFTVGIGGCVPSTTPSPQTH